jgi:hypothetical protein
MHAKTRLAGALVAAAMVLGALPTAAEAAVSSSPDGPAPAKTRAQRIGTARSSAFSSTALDPITFDDVPLGTDVYDEYADRGLIVTSSVMTLNDQANPTSPVLSGIPKLQGPIDGTFVDPGTGAPAAVASFTLDVGYINNRDSVVVDAYNSDDDLVQRVYAQDLGINTLTISYEGMAGFSVHTVEDEPAGFAIDNVTVDPAGDPTGAGSMVSMGDSYSSGEGLRHGRGLEYDCGTNLDGYYWRDTTMPANFGPGQWPAGPTGAFCDTRTLSTAFPGPADLGSREFAVYKNSCHRHGHAYPVQLAQALGASRFLFVACSGATTANVGAMQSTAKAQMPYSPVNVAGGNTQDQDAFNFRRDRLGGGDPDVITIGVGGNDAGFKGIIERCLAITCGPSYEQSVINKINGKVYDNLSETFDILRYEYPNSTIVAFGSPQPLSDHEDTCAGNPIVAPEQAQWLHDTVLPTLNQAVADAASYAGISYTDISHALDGHQLCAADEWINGLSKPIAESYHPNQDGHDAIERYVVAHYTDGRGGLIVHNPPYSGNPLRPATVGATGTIGTVTANAEQSCGVQGCAAAVPCIQGCSVHIQGSDFDPQARLQVVLHSDPVTLGTVTVDSDGNLDAYVQVPTSVPPGAHILTLDGNAPDGTLEFGTADLDVEAPPATPVAGAGTPSTAPKPPVSAPPKPRRVNVSVTVRRNPHRGTVTIRLACPKTASSTCAAKLALQATRKSGKRTRKVLTIRRTTKVKRGKAVRIVIRSRKLKARHLRLRLSITTATTAGTSRRTVTIRK